MWKMIPIVVLFVLPGCSEATLDGSSPAAFQTSLKSMQSGLSEEENREFSMAVARVVMKHNFAELMQRGMEAASNGEQPDITGGSLLSPEVLKELDGMTREEVIEHAQGMSAK